MYVLLALALIFYKFEFFGKIQICSKFFFPNKIHYLVKLDLIIILVHNLKYICIYLSHGSVNRKHFNFIFKLTSA